MEFDYMTPTAKELMNSPSFWKKRVAEQVRYFGDYEEAEHTRPDWKDVYESAINIGRKCIKNYREVRFNNESTKT